VGRHRSRRGYQAREGRETTRPTCPIYWAQETIRCAFDSPDPSCGGVGRFHQSRALPRPTFRSLPSANRPGHTCLASARPSSSTTVHFNADSISRTIPPAATTQWTTSATSDLADSSLATTGSFFCVPRERERAVRATATTCCSTITSASSHDLAKAGSWPYGGPTGARVSSTLGGLGG